MRYHYFHQTKENKTIDDWIVAKDRADAYAQLRKRGIKPYRLDGRNPLAWKRWTAIGVLAVSVVALSIALLVSGDIEADIPLTEERSQLYGDPAAIQRLSANGWRDAFQDEGDAFLARHAIPGALCVCAASFSENLNTTPISIEQDDSPELAKMKRMVNCMKTELKEYLASGGIVADYTALCCQRLRTERDIIIDTNRDFEKLKSRLSDADTAEKAAETWEKKNEMLRSLGLPTVVMPLAD